MSEHGLPIDPKDIKRGDSIRWEGDGYYQNPEVSAVEYVSQNNGTPWSLGGKHYRLDHRLEGGAATGKPSLSTALPVEIGTVIRAYFTNGYTAVLELDASGYWRNTSGNGVLADAIESWVRLVPEDDEDAGDVGVLHPLHGACGWQIGPMPDIKTNRDFCRERVAKHREACTGKPEDDEDTVRVPRSIVERLLSKYDAFLPNRLLNTLHEALGSPR